MRPRSLLFRYAAGLALAFLLSAAEVVVIVVSLGDQTIVGAQSVFTVWNLIATVALVVAGTVAVAVAGFLTASPLRSWLGSEREPTAAERRTALKISDRQTAILLVPWLVAAGFLIPLNLKGGLGVGLMIGFSIMFGATASISSG
ncbi:MAG: adenylate cyclase, partial [Mycobacterium sp.]|nr:adenylate cyclase [Mycobacterium sp.]